MGIHESGENYLETILILQNKLGFVRSIDIANELDYTKPSISRAVSILKKADYITMQENGQILLTEKGLQKANEIYDRHKIITSYLILSRQTRTPAALNILSARKLSIKLKNL